MSLNRLRNIRLAHLACSLFVATNCLITCLRADETAAVNIVLSEEGSIPPRKDARSPFPTFSIQYELKRQGALPKIEDLFEKLQGNLFGQNAFTVALAEAQGADLEPVREASRLLSKLESEINAQLFAAVEQAAAATADPDGVVSLSAVSAAINTEFRSNLQLVLDNVLFGPSNPEPTTRIEDNATLRATIAAITNTDPFVLINGSFTNTSETERLDVFVNFEQGLFDALPLDTPLMQQLLLDVEIEDTNGDGIAAADSANLDFSIFGTTDPQDPSTANTVPLGQVEGVFGRIGNSRDDSIEEGLRIVDDPAFVDKSIIEFNPDDVPDGTMISHVLGGMFIEDVSPGDTATFTAILSLGIEGDETVPLISVESLESIVSSSDVLALEATLPEPTSSAMLAFGFFGLLLLRRPRR